MMTVPVTSAAAGTLVDALPSEVHAMVKRELEADERMEWCAQPNANQKMRSSLPIVLFGVPWTALAVFWTVMASRSGGPFGLFGLPFVGVGLLMLSSPWWARIQARGSAYVITNRRVIILEKQSRGRVSVRSLLPHQVGELVRTQAADGSGDLTLALTFGEQRKEATFDAIDDVAAVERRLRAWLTASPQH
jgi:hypothetical protein